MLISADRSALLVIDVQERLLNHVDGWQAILDNVIWLVEVAKRIGVPIMLTEQYPKGLGGTVPVLAKEFAPAMVAEKVHFSCAAANCLPTMTGGDREQMVLCGIESHVCVMQTVLGLLAKGDEVHVAWDAVSGRGEAYVRHALERMRQAGAVITNHESVGFEWMRDKQHPRFRAMSELFKAGQPV